jgi:uncharacterized protein YbjT (DUF2867 family)
MTVLVTGATAGFGRAITRRFAKAGHKVVAAGRRLDRLQSLVTELGERQAHAQHLDVRDRQAVERGFESGYSAEEVQAARRFITQPNLDQLRGDADAAKGNDQRCRADRDHGILSRRLRGACRGHAQQRLCCGNRLLRWHNHAHCG